MVNWKAANYTAGFFSVFVFIITTIIYIMFLFSQRETIAAIGNTWDKINTKAQNRIQNMDDKITAIPSNARQVPQQKQELPPNNQPNPYQQVDESSLDKTEQPSEPAPVLPQVMTGGKMSGKILGATILELIALGFSAIIWGLTFGQATTGYSN